MRTRATSANATIGYQIHSYNDLRSWDQLLAKMLSSSSPFSSGELLARSALMIKIDPQYLSQAACAHQTRVPSSSSGCLVLNHDSVGAGSRDNINSTTDLLNFISDPSHARYFRNASRPVVISLCFKGCGGGSCPCDGSSGSLEWLSVVDNFFETATATVANNGLTVEFLLDGDGNPGQHACLANRWRQNAPYSMFISTDDPSAAFTSNDPTLGYDRLQVLNEPAGAVWSVAAALGFGKFAAGSRPFIVWEPSDALGMLASADVYLSHSPVAHEPGFRHAINTDIAQWASYTAPATGAWWRSSAPGPPGSIASPRRAPLLATMPGAWGGEGGHAALLLSSTIHANESSFVRTYASWAFETTAGSSVPPALATGQLPSSVDESANSLDLVPSNSTGLAQWA